MPVYPRWRGEHSARRKKSPPVRGLSPLARGTRMSGFTFFCQDRFIPAGAGNTKPCKGLFFDLPVYPRWRGEHGQDKIAGRSVAGLSPLARGTPKTKPARKFATRFIPAGAGNTFLMEWVSSSRSVYPRWRGEHGSQIAGADEFIGLSPLARGTRLTIVW